MYQCVTSKVYHSNSDYREKKKKTKINVLANKRKIPLRFSVFVLAVYFFSVTTNQSIRSPGLLIHHGCFYLFSSA